jgi:hypothetical protein
MTLFSASLCLLSLNLIGVLVFPPPQQTLAYMRPGTRLCAVVDSAKTVMAERGELLYRMPPGYLRFEINPKVASILRVFVPFDSVAQAQKGVPSKQIEAPWESVLYEHHHGCGYDFIAVSFTARNGKGFALAAIM